MERRLKTIEEEILKYGIPIHEPSYIPDAPDSLDLTYLKVSSLKAFRTKGMGLPSSKKISGGSICFSSATCFGHLTILRQEYTIRKNLA
jgi:hypothetical protein